MRDLRPFGKFEEVDEIKCRVCNLDFDSWKLCHKHCRIGHARWRVRAKGDSQGHEVVDFGSFHSYTFAAAVQATCTAFRSFCRVDMRR